METFNLNNLLEEINSISNDKPCIDYKKEYEKIKKELEEAKKELEKAKTELSQLKKKGQGCSVSGNAYEKKIFNIVKQTKINDIPFNSQNESELAGSSNTIDLECNFNGTKNVGIEIKKCKTPDWMQCSIKWNKDKKIWVGSHNGKIPEKSRLMFNKILEDIKLFDGEEPPFISKNITHKQWLDIKAVTSKWNDVIIKIPNDTIKKIYSEKDCHYIQISDYGLYHLNKDICNFDVPEFIIDQQLRIRIKVHSRKNKKGFCNLSVMASCQPTNINTFQKSKYSLDDKEKLPKNLIYHSV